MTKEIPSAKECAEHGVKEEIKYFVSLIGLGFHPDTDFRHYSVNHDMFSNREATKLNRRLNECFDMCEKYELDIYEITMEVMKPLLPTTTNP